MFDIQDNFIIIFSVCSCFGIILVLLFLVYWYFNCFVLGVFGCFSLFFYSLFFFGYGGGGGLVEGNGVNILLHSALRFCLLCFVCFISFCFLSKS